MRGNKLWIWVLISMVVLGVAVAAVSSRFTALANVGGFITVSVIATILFYVVWREVEHHSPPRLLLWITFSAFLLRLVAGCVWYLGLPNWGYGTEVETHGYVMADAYERDTAAWELAQTNQPLTNAFREYRKADQYGGLLFLSALVYRLFGGANHQPLLMVILTAMASAMTVPFVWVLGYRLWKAEAGLIGAWVVALYPNAVLLGSSQMREAFIMPLWMGVLYGYWLYSHLHLKKGIIIVALGVLITIPLSPFYTLMFLFSLAVIGVLAGDRNVLRNWRLWVGVMMLVAILLGAVILLGERILPGSGGNPLGLIQEWLKSASRWQAYVIERSSGWVQKIFRSTPQWTHTPLLIAYGIVQPFLPAALIADGQPVWKGIAIWRALGWTVLLPLLIYGYVRGAKNLKKERIALGLLLVIWFVLIIAAYRGGGDLWDNPRYRVSSIGLQGLLAGWLWVRIKHEPDPLLKRTVILIGSVLLWFIPWYLRRYTPWDLPVEDVFKTLTLGLITAMHLWLIDWVREQRKSSH